ncbi:MAG TPA: hypothetical protein VFL12_01480, partial [Thermoanaerobaculia bacterium]|nr:hypothetical protein [Thermoanaerobaculia bacterium]
MGILAALAMTSVLDASWVETGQFFRNGGAFGDQFTTQLAFDGDVAVVGEAFTGSVYVFTRSGNTWTWTATLMASNGDAFFGTRVAISGNVIAIAGGYGVYVFLRPAGGWTGTLTENARLEGGFGRVAFAGTSIAAPISSGIGVFNEPSSGWSGTVPASAILFPSDEANPGSDSYGSSLAGSADVIVVAAAEVPTGGHIDAGEAYVFVEPPGGWSGVLTESARLFPSDSADYIFFGQAVAV